MADDQGVKRTPPTGTPMSRTPAGGLPRVQSNHDLAAEGNRLRQAENDIRALQTLRESDIMQHALDMQAAMNVFKANTEAVEKNTLAVQSYAAQIMPLVTARADFLVVKRWVTIGGALVASVFAAILGAWKILDRYRGK